MTTTLPLPAEMPALLRHVRCAIDRAAPTPAVILIAGGTSTGKSSIVTAALAQWLEDARALSQDMQQSGDIKALDPRYGRDDPANYGIAACRDAVHAFVRGQAFPWPTYDFPTASHGPPQRIEPGRVLLLEGLYAADPTLTALADLTIYVEAPAIERLLRRLLRSRHERYPERPLEARSVVNFLTTVTAAHEAFVRPQRQRAELIVRTPLRFTELRQRFALQALPVTPCTVLWQAPFDTETRILAERIDTDTYRLRIYHHDACLSEIPLDEQGCTLLQTFDPQGF